MSRMGVRELLGPFNSSSKGTLSYKKNRFLQNPLGYIYKTPWNVPKQVLARPFWDVIFIYIVAAMP